MERGQPAVISDIREDPRIPQDVYRPTFVRSLAMVPIRALDPLGAIGLYWSRPSAASLSDVEVVQAIADATAVTMERLRADRALAARVEELEASNRALAEANEQLEHVASVIAHDLRSPLATVEGLLQTLAARTQHLPGSLEQRLTERATAQVDGLLGTVEALLMLSRSRTEPLLVEDVPLAGLVRDVVQALEAEIAEAGAEVRLDAGGTLRGDPVLLRLLLQNLVANAVRYRSPERPQVIRIALRRRDGCYELSVTDRGVGLDPDELDGLFELVGHRRARRGTTHGAGIGLVTCRRIAERHGGSIAVEPRTVGARFVVRLPEVPEVPEG